MRLLSSGRCWTVILCCCYCVVVMVDISSQGDPNFQAEGFFWGRQLSFYGSARMQVCSAAVRRVGGRAY